MAPLTGADVRNLRVLHAVWTLSDGQIRESVGREQLRELLESDPSLVGIDLNAELGVMSREVVEPADRCSAYRGVSPVVIVEVDPAG